MAGCSRITIRDAYLMEMRQGLYPSPLTGSARRICHAPAATIGPTFSGGKRRLAAEIRVDTAGLRPPQQSPGEAAGSIHAIAQALSHARDAHPAFWLT
ncbi:MULTISPECIES: hypothetical protein [unclassified Caballeronia]|jgi:hypothetical protein|uniref:hypothetical protein n=1 Tax=unclassified Caballeronia TaxID=2646786 RepID=UPI0028552DFC|nr:MULTISPECIES: hypothetical protein [unclassified Caballeronia]MDR5754218.1 hypothetical protein [Caballeronia sp. LZ024]MDR5840596.1 hypothetical protein [Caballeronia sp. LZ031]